MKDAIPENKILEQVIVQYLADMPKTKSLYRHHSNTKGGGGVSGGGRGDSGDERDEGVAGGGASSSASQQPSHRRHVLQVRVLLLLTLIFTLT